MCEVSWGSSPPPAVHGLGGCVREGSPVAKAVTAPAPRLLDQLREAIRLRHYSRRTEKAYVGWVRRFVLFHDKRHPKEMGKAEVSAFLSHLATEGRVSASTQNQALSALLFLYAQVLNQDIGWLAELVRAKRPARVPVVLTQEEARAVLAQLEGTAHLMASLLLRRRAAAARMLPAAGEGHRSGARRDRGARRQGRPGSGDHASAEARACVCHTT